MSADTVTTAGGSGSVDSPGATSGLADWLTYISTQHTQEIALGLERSQTVAERMGLLPLAPRNLIVAGTNGKGSTVRFAESLLLAQGYQVGTTLSPHMHRYNERVRLNGNEASDEQLVTAFRKVENGRGDIPLTYYEYSILAAFWLFKEADLDVCVLEVGLGGRLDVTNIVDAEVAAVTSIGLDHQSFLGDTLEEIGAEKAAVCRAGAPLLLGGDMPASVTALATERGASVSRFGHEFWYQRTSDDRWTLRLGEAQSSPVASVLPQVALRNAALACAAVSALTRQPSSVELTTASESCRHPGRFETVRWNDRTLVLDVAHNAASAQFLAQQLRARFPASAGQRFVACVGFLADKDVAAIGQAVAGLFAQWVLVSTTGPRGLPATAALERLKVATPTANGLGSHDTVGGAQDADELSNAIICEDLASGMIAAHANAGKADIIVAFGSFQQVQLVRELVFPHERGIT